MTLIQQNRREIKQNVPTRNEPIVINEKEHKTTQE